MLGEAEVFATIAVEDIELAKVFYGKTLGLHQTSENPGGVTFDSGGCRLFIYQSDNSGTNRATCAAWEVDDAGAVVAELKAKGVLFEHYDDLPGAMRDGDIHVMGGMQAAWFKDPDGNILNVFSTA